MQPMGRRPINFPGKTDCHPQKGYVNWWESDERGSKTAEKREAKNRIVNETEEYITERSAGEFKNSRREAFDCKLWYKKYKLEQATPEQFCKSLSNLVVWE